MNCTFQVLRTNRVMSHKIIKNIKISRQRRLFNEYNLVNYLIIMNFFFKFLTLTNVTNVVHCIYSTKVYMATHRTHTNIYTHTSPHLPSFHPPIIYNCKTDSMHLPYLL